MPAKSPHGAIVLLCGLPAAGKTSLASALLRSGARELLTCLEPHGHSSVRIVHVCFDDVLATAHGGSAEFSPDLWHEARSRILNAVRCHIGQAVGGSPLADVGRSSEVARLRTGNDSGAPFDILLLDDNMQYRSMRRVYHRLARDGRLAFCTVCLPVPLEEVLARNARREGAARVTDATLVHMSEVLQWPDPEAHSWEANVLTLEPGAAAESFPWNRLAALVAQPVPHPTQLQGEAAEAARAEAAAATASSAAHALDLKLRRATSLHLQARATQALPAAERAALSRALSDLKKQLLVRAKAVLGADATGEVGEALADELDAAFTAIFARVGVAS